MYGVTNSFHDIMEGFIDQCNLRYKPGYHDSSAGCKMPHSGCGETGNIQVVAIDCDPYTSAFSSAKKLNDRFASFKAVGFF